MDWRSSFFNHNQGALFGCDYQDCSPLPFLLGACFLPFPRFAFRAVFLAVLVASCSPDIPTGTLSSIQGTPAPSLIRPGGDLSPQNAFDINLEVHGRLIPGSPITVTASVRANVGVQAGLFRIVPRSWNPRSSRAEVEASESRRV